MPDEHLYDVVVVTHGHAQTLPACLGAVAGLVPAPRSVVVVDNASGDASAEMAAAWHDRLPLEVLRRPDNSGFAAGLNQGLSRSTAPWVLSLNPDCAPRPDFVARLLELMCAAPQAEGVGAVTGRLLRGRGPGIEPEGVLDAAGMVVTPSGRHLDRGAGEPDDGRYGQAARVFGGTAAATLYRRHALEDVAYPDGQVLAESFFAYREDAELAWRLQWRGWSCLYAPLAVAIHRRGFRPEAGRRGHDLVNLHSVKNRFLLRLHCADLAWHLRCFPWWLLRDLAVVAACLSVETSSLPALRQLWRLRKDARRRRRWVLSRATAAPREVAGWFRRGGHAESLQPTAGP